MANLVFPDSIQRFKQVLDKLHSNPAGRELIELAGKVEAYGKSGPWKFELVNGLDALGNACMDGSTRVIQISEFSEEEEMLTSLVFELFNAVHASDFEKIQAKKLTMDGNEYARSIEEVEFSVGKKRRELLLSAGWEDLLPYCPEYPETFEKWWIDEGNCFAEHGDHYRRYWLSERGELPQDPLDQKICFLKMKTRLLNQQNPTAFQHLIQRNFPHLNQFIQETSQKPELLSVLYLL